MNCIAFMPAALSNNAYNFIDTVTLEGKQTQWRIDNDNAEAQFNKVEAQLLAKDNKIQTLQLENASLKQRNSNLQTFHDEILKIKADGLAETVRQRDFNAQMRADRQAEDAEMQIEATQDAAWAAQRAADALEQMNWDLEFNSIWKK
jgi:hypothetical protein